MIMRLWLLIACLLCAFGNSAFSETEVPSELADMIPQIHNQLYDAVQGMMKSAYGEGSMQLDKLQALHQMVNGESKSVESSSSMTSRIQPEIIVPSISTPPSRSGLTPSCNNKLCAFFEKALSCKGIGIDMKQICAQYLLGFIFQCSDFPPPSAFYQAPSVCLLEYVSFLGTLAPALSGQTSTVVASLTSFLYTNYSSNSCERRCYNKFRDYGNTLYQDCGAAITKLNATYPLAYALGEFSDFRNQGCDVNAAGGNCFEGLQKLLAQPPVEGLQPFSIFQFNCIYQTGPYASLQPFILPGICSTFKSLGGCCAGSAIVLASQNQLPTGSLKIFPPCLLTYLTGPACGISLSDLCVNQSVASQSTLQATLFVASTALIQPETTKNTSVLYMMGVVSGALAYAGFGKQPFNFQSGFPFQVIVISNTTVAGGRDFALQLTMSNLNSTELTRLTASVSPANPLLTGALSAGFKGTATMNVAGPNPSLLLEPEPLVFAAAYGGGGGSAVVTVAMAGGLGLLMLLWT